MPLGYKKINPNGFNCACQGNPLRISKVESGIRAFTLVELLIVLTIFSVVSVAVYSTFNSGMNVWRRAGKVSAGEIKNLIKIEKINRELRQAVILEKVGDKKPVSGEILRFWTVINSEIYFVIYLYKKEERILMRKVTKFKDYIAEEGVKRDRLSMVPYIEEVDDFSFAYFYFDLEKGKYQWGQAWGWDYLPLAVKLNMTIGNETYTSTIFIPSA